MTRREVYYCTQAISKRTKAKFIFQAKIHGAEIKDQAIEKIAITKEHDNIMTKHLEKINKERFGK